MSPIPPTALVVTTVFEPAFLEGYLEAARRYGHEREVSFHVIVDRKTPPSVAEACRKAARDGFSMWCPQLDEQARFVSSLGLADDFVPWDSDNRRNVGFLKALEAGCQVLVSIDDDNLCLSGSDFFAEHTGVLGVEAAARVACGDAFADAAAPALFNACSLLDIQPGVSVFPRGFPYRSRGPGAPAPSTGAPVPSAPIAANAGLWLGDPDVDAVTRLALAPRAQAFRGPSTVLGARAWSPLNTQNTALTREAALSYYYVRMGEALLGMTLDRYGDILSGYFLQACAKHLGRTVRLGTPVAEHRRTPHDLLRDLYHELSGMVLLEDLVPWLFEVRLSGSSFLEAYDALADALEGAAGGFGGPFWRGGGQAFLGRTAGRMRAWTRAVTRFA